MLNWRNPVAFFANALGDHLINLPALRALSGLAPNRLTLVTRDLPAADLFEELPLHRLIRIPAPISGSGRWFDAPTLAADLGEVDCFLSLNPWHSEAVDRLLDAITPQQSIGFFPGFRTVLPLDFSKHSADLAFDVVRAADSNLLLEDFAAPVNLPQASREFARLLRQRCDDGRPLLVVHAETKPEKRWGADEMAYAIRGFTEARRCHCIVVGEHETAVNMEAATEAIPALDLPFLSAVALIGEADLFLGVDSFPLHAADLARVPGVGVFGPTESKEFGFRFSRIHRHVTAGSMVGTLSVREVVNALVDVADQIGFC